MSAAHGVLVREFSRVCLLSLRLNPAVLAKFFRVVKICYAQRFTYRIKQGKIILKMRSRRELEICIEV